MSRRRCTRPKAVRRRPGNAESQSRSGLRREWKGSVDDAEHFLIFVQQLFASRCFGTDIPDCALDACAASLPSPSYFTSRCAG